jgi:uncharacterized protein YkwD
MNDHSIPFVKTALQQVNSAIVTGINKSDFKLRKLHLTNRQNAQGNVNLIIGGALILLTAIFAFMPNSANPSSIPAFKSYALSIINNERINFHLQPLHQGPDILADNQAKFLLTQPPLTHLDASGNTPSERYSKNNQTGYVAENLSV